MDGSHLDGRLPHVASREIRGEGRGPSVRGDFVEGLRETSQRRYRLGGAAVELRTTSVGISMRVVVAALGASMRSMNSAAA